LSENGRRIDHVHPVWSRGALIYTGDSHACRAMAKSIFLRSRPACQELRIEVVLHKQKNFAWPVAETPTHWIT